MIDFSSLTPRVALSPLDGRYARQTAPLLNSLSTAALNRERLFVETEWMIFLADGQDGTPIVPGLAPLTQEEKDYLRRIVENFGAEGIAEHAAIEKVTHHDVKAVEYYIDRRLDDAQDRLSHPTALTGLKPLVHLFCTSEDINNLSWALCVRHAMTDVWLPRFDRLLDLLLADADAWRDLPLLAMTHGQPATPTTLGKEMAVVVYRLSRQRKKLGQTEYLGKFNGATGTFGAHTVALPQADWPRISRSFVEGRLGLTWNPLTTQIESHDWIAELFGTLSHTGRILHDLCVDMWMYISRGVFHQIPVKGATGSSTMPHKVNPINFENAEANFEISCSFLDTLAATLVESRWQRDLTDSTTLRNMGSALGYSLLALSSLTTGMERVRPDTAAMAAELDDNWEVLGEPIQTMMRVAGLEGRPGMDRPYERVKELMRGRKIGKKDVEDFVASLGLDAADEERLGRLTPSTYTGLAPRLVDFADEAVRKARS
jgi:adenylosuccinate lyase